MSEMRKGNLISVRPDLRVMDCTMRDGGLVNNFEFSDQFVRDLYLANIRAGVDYMEFGYKASRDIFPEDKFGKWKFCKDEDIRNIVGDNKTDLKIAVMADVGRTDYQNDILPKNESPIDMIRVATYINAIPSAIAMIEDAHAKGYETTCNIMAISKCTREDLRAGLEMIAQSSVDVIYLVDSFGTFYPEQMHSLLNIYLEISEKYGKKIGIHAHNNQQLAFANTIECLSLGTSFLDATVSGMGRGAGNCYMESLLTFLRNPRYNINPIMAFVEKHILPLRQQGVVWGYDIPYLLTGVFNAHPSSAIDFIKNKRTDYTMFYQELIDSTF